MAVSDITLPPLRSLNDFLLGSARFQIPNYNDVDRWGNRVVNNILYYQTNYFVMTLLVFLCVGCFHPTKMVLGSSGITSAFIIYRYLTRNKRALEFKKKYPWFGIATIMIGGYIIVYLFDSVLVFLFGIVMPICLVFLHSSLRIRSVKNKLNNKIELIGLRTSPMGKFLELLAIRRHSLRIRRAAETFKKSLIQLSDAEM